MDDVSQDGVGLIEESVQIYDNYGFETKVLAASIRHPKHMVDVLMGADVATLPFSVLQNVQTSSYRCWERQVFTRLGDCTQQQYRSSRKELVDQ